MQSSKEQARMRHLEEKEAITQRQKQQSVEHEGHIYGERESPIFVEGKGQCTDTVATLLSYPSSNIISGMNYMQAVDPKKGREVLP